MSTTQRFYIKEHLIDLSRSEVTFAQQTTKVEPKVLQVLRLLAQNAQEVVSHQQIMEEVWQGSEVVPNALQRCIARLRKVLGDDAKSPRIIATHPKIGYRLMVDVQWLPQTTRQGVTIASPPNLKTLGFIGITLILVLTTVLGIWQSMKTPKRSIHSLKQITYTDAFESEATYSPDGLHMLFNRNVHACQSHIWAKNLKTGVESQLTKHPGFYRDTRFTPDGRSIIFTKQKSCHQDKINAHEPLQANCWQIDMIDFAEALNAPQAASVRYQCQNRAIERPVALANHQYAFLSQQGNAQALLRFNAINQQTTSLFSPEHQTIYTYDYDPIKAQYAVLSYNREGRHLLSLLNLHGELLHQNQIDTHGELGQLSIRFSAHDDALLAVLNGKLYHLALDGKTTPYHSAVHNIVSAQSHPTLPSMIAIQGTKDTDIARIPLYGEQETSITRIMNQHVQPYPSFARSKSREKYAKFQPNGELIAFISARSGQDQIWLWNGNQATQLSYFSKQSKIEQFSWSPDGQKLAVVSNAKLNILDLQGGAQIIKAPEPLIEVLNWHPHFGILVTALRPSAHTLWRLDLKTQVFTTYAVDDVQSTWLTDHTLYLSKFDGQVFKRPLNSDTTDYEPMPTLNGHSMVLYKQYFYSYDMESDYLTQYDLNGELIRKLKPLKPFAWKISDIKGEHVLLEQLIELNQDVVELNI
ncbi:hypothetical protein JF50_11925 [Pseudoalteromonas luteoviolacea]|uniref:OmpR/PhoB-type domain-containing protein n=1 Tax=Pseudoalteromonas luteoviolacea TaxID=43657 RepID=A0A0C1QB57_9GAMM|nr:winged helix-turn-helix domain-containing protein [Pseudoalteromonas luteoviolacea]KID56630.1 hypothetical protein JF50_11925 [Pseudoalteromonas luteoviolacea]